MEQGKEAKGSWKGVGITKSDRHIDVRYACLRKLEGNREENLYNFTIICNNFTGSLNISLS